VARACVALRDVATQHTKFAIFIHLAGTELHPLLTPPVVLSANTAIYQWVKAADGFSRNTKLPALSSFAFLAVAEMPGLD
jgi:hypothetical protein